MESLVARHTIVFLSLVALSFGTCDALLLGKASGGVASMVDDRTKAEFMEYVQAHDTYAEHYTYGVGEAFTASLMLSSQIKVSSALGG
jgi:hypothetical protein